MRALIVGGTGNIGRRLVNYLISCGYLVTVVSRQPYKPASLPAKIIFAQWDGKTAKGWSHLLEENEAVVNLAGTGVADQRWTAERKKDILESRLSAGRAVVEAFEAASRKPKVLIQASAVGYYGSRGDETLTESSPPGNDYLAEVCKQWEASTQAVEQMEVRRVVIRTGVMLDPRGGALPQMMFPFSFGAGGSIAGGRQWFPWIHYEDEAAAIHFLIEHATARGPINLAAPNPIRNRDFAKTLGKVLKRPAFAPTPGLALKVMFGEMAEVLLASQRLSSERLQTLGYPFKCPELEGALRDLLGKPQS